MHMSVRLKDCVSVSGIKLKARSFEAVSAYVGQTESLCECDINYGRHAIELSAEPAMVGLYSLYFISEHSEQTAGVKYLLWVMYIYG